MFVAGDAGVGKFRLLAEARGSAAGAGMAVFAGRGVERATAAYRPLAEALRAAFREADPPADTSLAPFVPALARVLPEWDRPAKRPS